MKPFREEIYFSPEGGADTDSTARAVAKGDYRGLHYCRLGNVSGQGATIITSLGTTIVLNQDLDVEDRIVGAGVWVKENAIVYLVYKFGLPDEVWMYDISADTHVSIFSSDDLNFDPAYPFFHVDIIDDLLRVAGGKWDANMYDTADGSIIYNYPWGINLRKALDGDYAIIDQQVLSAIKWPALPPVATYSTDSAHQDNKLRRKLFRFRVQYIYENNEETVWSMWSNLALPSESEFVSGNNWPVSTQDNVILLTFNSGAEVVKKINVAAQTYDEGNASIDAGFGIFQQIDKAVDGISDDATVTINFYGNVALKPISNLKGNYDRLPIYSRCQSLVDNTKVAYTNIVEGYDKLSALDVTVTPVYNEIVWNPLRPELDVTSASPGMTSAVATFFWTSTAVFNIAAGDTFSVSLVLSDGQVLLLSYTITQADIDAALLEATVADQFFYILGVIVDAYAVQTSALLGITATSIPNSPFAGQYRLSISGSVYEFVYNGLLVSPERQTNATPSFKVGATHPFGIVYGDDAFRDSTVMTNDGMSMFVPWYSDIDTLSFVDPNNPFTVSAQMSINHLPPVWAKWYWIVWRKATEISDFSQWVINATIPSGSVSGTAIVADTNRYVISLDKYYLLNYKGASIEHIPAKGDVARFVRQRLDDTTGVPSPYVDNFFELQVMEFYPAGATSPGSGNRPAIVVELFDRTLVDPSVFTGQLIEIYTPQPTIDEDGSLFLAQWRDGSEALEIGDPHTINRHHKAVHITGRADLYVDGMSQYVYLYGDMSSYVGAVVSVLWADSAPPFDQEGVIDGATYIPGANPLGTEGTTLITISGGWTQPGYINVGDSVFDIIFGTDQDVVDGVSLSPAIIDLEWGDVYIRQRNYQTGYSSLASIGDNAFWYIEDPHYSDYWLSNIHQYGRINIESNYARQTHRIATSIHSDSFQPDTQINGLSSFSLLNDNIMDMNPVYGEVIKTLVSGREEKTLKCIQERKENSIYIKHYPDVATVPAGDLRVDRETTFSAWYPLKGIYGTLDAGSCVLWPDGTTYYFDRINGCFIHSSESGQVMISERDPSTGRDFKFSTRTRELTRLLTTNAGSYIRSYVDFTQQEIGWGFAIAVDPQQEGDIVLFNDGQTIVSVEGTLANITPLIGNVITFVLTVDDPDDPIQYFSSTVVDASQGLGWVDITIADTTPIQAISGTYLIEANYEYQMVTFDVLNGRWRSEYDYNFQWFANFGEVLVGWGQDTQMYLHNQDDSFTFHGENFEQKIVCVSNSNPLAIKRYHNITQRSDVPFNVLAYAEENESYTAMETEMPSYLFNCYQGYFKYAYKRNKFTPLFATEEMAMMNGEELQAHSITHELTYIPTDQRAIFFAMKVDGIENDMN